MTLSRGHTGHNEVIIVTCMTKEDPFKMRALEWSQKIFHCKSMQIFYNTQGQLTQQSEVISTESSNSSKFYGCPCYLKE